MIKHLSAGCVLFAGLILTPSPVHAQMRTVTGSASIADTIGQLFGEIAEATNALDVDRLLRYHADGDALTYVAQGRVTRSKAAFGRLLSAQLGGLAAADVRWRDLYIDVLSDDVAVATATYELTATFPDGDSVRTTGTYMCIYVRHEGGWDIRYSTHTFPPRQ
jgi:ketosteroid isomerase-like protein